MGPQTFCSHVCVAANKTSQGSQHIEAKAEMCFLRDMIVRWRRAWIGTLIVKPASSIRCPSSKSKDLRALPKTAQKP